MARKPFVEPRLLNEMTATGRTKPKIVEFEGLEGAVDMAMLRKLGVRQLEAKWSWQNDEGVLDDIRLVPDMQVPREVMHRIENWVYHNLYGEHVTKVVDLATGIVTEKGFGKW